ELDLAAGADRRLDEAAAALRRALPGADEPAARRLAGLIATALQGALLVRHAPPAVADAFCASRLGPAAAGGGGYAFGTLPGGLDLDPVLDRARVTSL
ncbi:MAG TPA: DNA alkylation response protein, partial [Streptosporangiaceae bacterium]|nr:DNA alkylation response protein [Streptosporangiaceae bacterium]